MRFINISSCTKRNKIHCLCNLLLKQKTYTHGKNTLTRFTPSFIQIDVKDSIHTHFHTRFAIQFPLHLIHHTSSSIISFVSVSNQSSGNPGKSLNPPLASLSSMVSIPQYFFQKKYSNQETL